MPARRGTARARQWWVRTLSPRLLAAANENSSLQELQQLEQDIVRYNHGRPLNVNSPKQVSLALFGTVQRTTVQVLTQASMGVGVQHERQQTLANLILQHRALARRAKQRQQSTAFSTLASHFVAFTMLRRDGTAKGHGTSPVTNEEPTYVSTTIWRDCAAFENWRTGGAFQKAHGGAKEMDGEKPPAPLWSKPPTPVFYEGTLVISSKDGA